MMRSIQTYIIRLMVDDDTPGQLKGALTTTLTNQSFAFQDAESLVRLLSDLAYPRRVSSIAETEKTPETRFN